MVTIAFVIHGGELEVKSALLAASLKQKCHGDIRRCAIVMQPEKRWGAISDAARAILERTGTEMIPCTNQIDIDYPHGNKIAALENIDGPAIFLDSDMVMMRPFLTHYSLVGEDAAVKPADFPTFERSGGDWQPVYDLFDLPLPQDMVRATISQEWMLPYYNAGMVFVKDGRSFSKVWLDTSRIIDASDAVRAKRPWLDQVALPIAFARLGWEVGDADLDLNFPGHAQQLPSDETYLPYIMHYHSPDRIGICPRLTRDVHFYRSKYPELNTLFHAHEDWAFLAEPESEPESEPEPEPKKPAKRGNFWKR